MTDREDPYKFRRQRWGEGVRKWLEGTPPASVSFTERRSGPGYGSSPGFGDHKLDFSRPQNIAYTCVM